MARYGHLHQHGGYRNAPFQRRGDRVLANPPPPPPPQTHVHIYPYYDWFPPHNSIFNTAVMNYNSDVYATMTSRPTPRSFPPLNNISNTAANYHSDVYANRHPSRMIDDNLVIDASTISPNTIHGQQQMMIDGHSIVDRNGEAQLSEEAISRHMTTRAATREDAAEICTVCQDDLHEEGNNQFIATLHCGHGYHAKCIKRWVRRKNVCPLCNAVAVVPEDM